MHKTSRRRLTLAVTGTIAMTLGVMAPAVAASAAPAPGTVKIVQGDASASFGRLVLEPTERGYQGNLQITVRNQGTDPGSFRMLIREPVASSMNWRTSPEQFCQTENAYPGHRTTYGCFLNQIAPGGSLTFSVSFAVLTATKPYPMTAPGGRIAISDGYALDVPFSKFKPFETLFRSTSGSLRDPRPYQQDTRAKSSIVVADEVTLTRGDNGWYTGRLEATVTYNGDAAHDYLWFDTLVADDRAILVATDPAGAPCWRSCEAPGGRLMAGESRTFGLIFEAAPDAVPGLIEASGTMHALWQGAPVAEKNTSDNAFAFKIRIPEPA
ncbi:hypothetical protein I0C86_11295 [Plantactinospora sp. S1510]|uniref:Uncharacterized protein n=1 Tax=Plantactinospora alkalitolerans TaxID=2789879 RepID=A0ABS0GTL5_9ACTN|nr:hypothetical protein [Plantactinospora alkalitolerans]MBF9129546.1 hypothetical protein [Plantactinospora alkalitolerans]